jgi:hypothetical protein
MKYVVVGPCNCVRNSVLYKGYTIATFSTAAAAAAAIKRRFVYIGPNC